MAEAGVGPALARRVRRRARGVCEYCKSQERFATNRFSIDHILPASQGGLGRFENLALACQGCNNRKYTRTSGHDPISGEIAPLFHPRLDTWSDHFIWSDDCCLLLGLSPTGRATVEALGLNRLGLIRLRRALYHLGEHPPPV